MVPCLDHPAEATRQGLGSLPARSAACSSLHSCQLGLCRQANAEADASCSMTAALPGDDALGRAGGWKGGSARTEAEDNGRRGRRDRGTWHGAAASWSGMGGGRRTSWCAPAARHRTSYIGLATSLVDVGRELDAALSGVVSSTSHEAVVAFGSRSSGRPHVLCMVSCRYSRSDGSSTRPHCCSYRRELLVCSHGLESSW
jgi:hypothetical protein